MLSLFLRRSGVYNKRRNGLVITRLYRKGCKSEGLNFGEQTKNQYERIRLEKYPEVKNEQIRLNITDIHNVEKTRLPCERVRDISGKCINVFSCKNEEKDNNEIPFDSNDIRIENYNCSGLLNLSSSMQTSVPYPFQVKVKITHLNMPGGQWRQQAKYIAEQLQSFHYRSFSSERGAAEDNQKQPEEPKKKFTLKGAVKEYGSIVVVVHITLSLASLGIIYLLISSGVDMEGLVKKWGISEGATTAGTVGPFVAAYALHKVLAPFRLSLTLLVTPILVKFKRKWVLKLKGK